MNTEFWQGRRVFLTGHTGFKGSWLAIWLQHLGAEVYGYALDPVEGLSLFEFAQVHKRIRSTIGDIRSLPDVRKALEESRAEIVFHLAAQPLVKASYQNPVETYATNVMGTVNLLESVRSVDSVRAVLNVTTDKVYENQERLSGYAEEDRLGGYDPYSNSKACSEMVTSSYTRSFFNPQDYERHGVAVAAARAGNVIGGGDWAKDRLVPDLIRSMSNQEEVTIRNPGFVRPWQHVLEPLRGYLMLAEKLHEERSAWNGAWNFGPMPEDSVSVGELTALFHKNAGSSFSEINYIPSHEHETAQLRLNIDKSMTKLGWKPKWNLEKALQKILEWHAEPAAEAYNLCIKQIEEYENA